MAQAQISTKIGTFLVQTELTITADMGITKIIVSAFSKTLEPPTIQGTLNLGRERSQPIPLNQFPITIENGGQPLNGIILTGQIQIIAFQ